MKGKVWTGPVSTSCSPARHTLDGVAPQALSTPAPVSSPAPRSVRRLRSLITRSPDTGVALRLSKVLDGELVSELVLTLTGVDLDLLVSVFLHLLLVLRGVTIPRGREFVVPRPELVPPLLDLLACEAVLLLHLGVLLAVVVARDPVPGVGGRAVDHLVLHLMPGLMGGDLQAVGAVQQVAAEVDDAALQRDRPAADPAGHEADLDVRQQMLVHPVGRDLVVDDLPEHGPALGLGRLSPRALDRGVVDGGDPVTGVEGDTGKGREDGQRVPLPGRLGPPPSAAEACSCSSACRESSSADRRSRSRCDATASWCTVTHAERNASASGPCQNDSSPEIVRSRWSIRARSIPSARQTASECRRTSWVSIPSMPLIPAPIARSPAIRLSADTVRECTRPGQAQLLPCGQPARDAHAADRGRHEGGTPGGVPPSRMRSNDERSDHSAEGSSAGASPGSASSSITAREILPRASI